MASTSSLGLLHIQEGRESAIPLEAAVVVGWVSICAGEAREEESELDLQVKGPGSGH